MNSPRIEFFANAHDAVARIYGRPVSRGIDPIPDDSPVPAAIAVNIRPTRAQAPEDWRTPGPGGPTDALDIREPSWTAVVLYRFLPHPRIVFRMGVGWVDRLRSGRAPGGVQLRDTAVYKTALHLRGARPNQTRNHRSCSHHQFSHNCD